MASSTTKPVQKILDSTKLASLSKFIRKPPIDPKTTIQGKIRDPNSNAFKEYAKREGLRLQKALNAITHGKDIFVYHNVRTKQVVYSLTRYLEENNVLRQMIYHGKKTIPAELRRDMWVPYYSVHFSSSRLGLRAYHLLREFSMQRQLAPPQEMITVTEEYLTAKRPRDPVEAEKFDRINKKRLGQTMEKKERARVLMDQKATSVADIAAVLGIQQEAIENGLLERSDKPGYLTKAARRRRREAFNQALELEEKRGARVAELEEILNNSSLMDVDVKIGDPEGSRPEDPLQVKILWQDVHDAHYAESWIDGVEHGQLKLGRSPVMPSEQVLHKAKVLAEDGFTEDKKE
ncbi:hypothetical protein N7478_004992 [Penicillium angulare]|uniref:uncharacterized protein n=1 Tax=Penicillium angulare TaxID=116970 RepID=UPI00253FA01E|nr:uncharacterized protein N7478_004992 [Penicillium angulare]KAJ5279620.1 hypothetical protein N7478_004992 [Penicillium angulare]